MKHAAQLWIHVLIMGGYFAPLLGWGQPHEAPTFVQGVGIGGEYVQYIHGLETDTAGNVYVAGYFFNQLCFFNDTCVYADSIDFADMFIASYDPMANLRWVRTFGGKGTDIVYDMDMGPEGNLYLAGGFSDTAYFGEIHRVSQANDWATWVTDDACWVKVDQAGEVIEVQTVGGTNWDMYYNISVSNQGRVGVGGYFTSDSLCANSFCEPADSTIQIGGNFFAHYNHVSLKQIRLIYPNQNGVPSGFFIGDIAWDREENVVIAGANSGYFALLDTGDTQTVLENPGGKIVDIEIDQHGDTYLLLQHNTPHIWRGLSLNPGYALIKIAPNDSIVWAFQSEELQRPFFSDLHITPDGIYTTGWTRSTFSLNGQTIDSWGEDILILQHSPEDGAIQWVHSAGLGGDEQPYHLSVDPQGRIVLGGLSLDYTIGMDSVVLQNPYGGTEFIWLAWSTPDPAFTVGIEPSEAWTSTHLRVYPNPTSGQVRIQSMAGQIFPHTLAIYNQQGQILQQRTWPEGLYAFSVDLSAYPNGLYLIQVQSAQGAQIHKVIKRSY